jgi:hypothetical protein
MSGANENRVSDSLIDRLVDGELDETERQRLLDRLEIEPGGWRRCALAFLEAQEWTRTLSCSSETVASRCQGTVSQSPTEFGETAHVARRRREPAGRRFQRAARLAAGILLAFASGWMASVATRPLDSPTAPNQGVAVSAALTTSKAPTAIAQERRGPTGETDLERSEASVVPPPDDSSWDAEAPLVVSEPVRRELERQGYRVEQRSGLISMELQDGQSLAVPVDEVELHYVGNRTY